MATLWKISPDLEQLNSLHEGTLGEVLGMEFIEVGDDYLRMRMPVDQRTIQPMGLLHGGASAALAETAGSVASNLCIDPDRQAAVGLELNCSHLRGVRSGYVYAKCSPIRIGKSVHVWNIMLTNEQGKASCVSRLTVSIIELSR